MDIIPWYWKAGAALLAVVALYAAGDAYLTHRDDVAYKRGYDKSEGEWKQREAGIAEAARAHAQQDKPARYPAAFQEVKRGKHLRDEM